MHIPADNREDSTLTVAGQASRQTDEGKMLTVEHWQAGKKLTLAESKSGVRVTRHPLDNIVQTISTRLTPPELLQKFYADSFCGRTPADDQFARDGLGYYCNLQSLNSEDSLTWSIFGTLAHMSPEARHPICTELFKQLELPLPSENVLVWLWRRIPHPEKLESIGGPEIDFGLMTPETLILGEAKWNSPLGTCQGVNKDRSQLDLRLAYCEQLAPQTLPSVRHRVILGVGRSNDILPATVQSRSAQVRSLTWNQIASLFPAPLAAEFERYLEWRRRHAREVVGPQQPERA